MQPVVVVAPLQGIATFTIIIQPGGARHKNGKPGFLRIIKPFDQTAPARELVDLIAGGYGLSTAELVRYTEYDYSVVASTMQPAISQVNGSSAFSAKLVAGDTYGMTDGVVVKYCRAANYVSKVGNADSWIWAKPDYCDYPNVPSGSAASWQWRAWEPGSGRQVPQGGASTWTWGTE